MLSQLPDFGFPPGFVPFSEPLSEALQWINKSLTIAIPDSEQFNAGSQFPDPPPLIQTQSPMICETAPSCWPPAPPTPPAVSRDHGFAQGNLLGLVDKVIHGS